MAGAWLGVLLWLTASIVELEASTCYLPRTCWSTAVVWDSNYTHQCPENDLCLCSITTLNCSSNHGKLTYVPRVQGHFKMLNFSNNDLGRISNRHFFTNVSRSVTVVDLYQNNLSYIVEGVFDDLPNLSWLSLGGNPLLLKDVFNMSIISTLSTLDVGCMGFQSIPGKAVKHLGNSTLVYLHLEWNCIETFDMTVLSPLRQLQYLSLWKNDLYSHGLTAASLPQLRTLNMMSNRLFNFPDTCNSTGGSFFPKLVKATLAFNRISRIGDTICLPKLEYLELSYNPFKYIFRNSFSAHKFPSLQTLLLGQLNIKMEKIERFAFNNFRLQNIDVALNQINFSSSVVDGQAFAGCTGLTSLLLRGNDFSSVTENRFVVLFRSLTNLTHLSIGSSKMAVIYPRAFGRFRQLKWLHLFENDFTYIPDGAFDSLRNLMFLHLDSCRISRITKSTFSVETLKRLKTLDLSSNPFQCNCDILWFQQCVRSNPHIFSSKWRPYVCVNEPGVALRDFELNEQACLLGSDATAFTIAVTCVVLSFLLLFVIFFRFRWHVRLWLYEACRASRHDRRRQLVAQGLHYRYDVFVAYAAEDLAWVQRELLPVLEGEWGLRLCVHQRDFEPGKHIVDNISDCVNDSERVVLVFSPHFALSEWCQFELKYCQGCVMERDDVMVLVELQEIPSRNMTGAMLAVLRTTTYIEWRDEQDARESFWARLRLAFDD